MKNDELTNFIDSEIISRELARGMLEQGLSQDDDKFIQKIGDEIGMLKEIRALIESAGRLTVTREEIEELVINIFISAEPPFAKDSAEKILFEWLKSKGIEVEEKP